MRIEYRHQHKKTPSPNEDSLRISAYCSDYYWQFHAHFMPHKLQQTFWVIVAQTSTFSASQSNNITHNTQRSSLMSVFLYCNTHLQESVRCVFVVRCVLV